MPLIDRWSLAPNEVTHGTKADGVLAMDAVVANASTVPSTTRTRPVLSLGPTLLASNRWVVIGRRAEPDRHNQCTNPHYRRQDSNMVRCHKGADHQKGLEGNRREQTGRHGETKDESKNVHRENIPKIFRQSGRSKASVPSRRIRKK